MNNAGRIGFLVRGEYDSSATYDYLDVVLFGNSSYVAKKTTIGNEPAEDNEYWQILAKTPDSTVTGVKGNAEAAFRKGDINITPENIGALPSDGTAASAARLSGSNTIDGVAFDGSANISHYGTCTTESAVAEKTVSIPGFVLEKGAIITVYFQNKNTSINTSLNVNAIGARTIHYNGTALTSENSGVLSGCCEFAYNGSYWYLISAHITPENIGLGNVDNTADKDKSVSNADTVDGKHAADFANSSHTHTSSDITDKLDSNAASALSTSDKLVTERNVYHGLPKINGSHDYSSETDIYAPTTGGTEGYELVGNGTTSEPVWKAPNYGECETDGKIAEKTISITNFTLVTGASVKVLFNNGNTAIDPTLNVNSTGAKPIYYKNKNIIKSSFGGIKANCVYEFVYDGSHWRLVGEIGADGIVYAAGNIEFRAGIGDPNKLNLVYLTTKDYELNGFYPFNPISLGNSSMRWGQIYSINGAISTSDRNKKREIKNISEPYEKLFMMLQPRTYMFKTGDRIHIGAISQEVEDAMNSLGISPEEFGGFCKDHDAVVVNDENGNIHPDYLYDENGKPIYTYSLRYEEFIFLTIHMVQKNIQKIDELEKRISALESGITSSESIS